jgi:hypothetical protein
MLELKYEDYNFDHAAGEAIDQGVSFCVVIKGLRARLIIKAKPLIWLLFDNPEHPIRSKRFTIFRLQVMYLTWTSSFWAIRFLATRAGMKESWAEKNGILMVSFLIGGN